MVVVFRWRVRIVSDKVRVNFFIGVFVYIV